MFVRLRQLTTLLTAAAVLCHLLVGCCRFSASGCCAGEMVATHEAEHEHDCGHDHESADIGHDDDHGTPHRHPCRGHCLDGCTFSATMTQTAAIDLTPAPALDCMAVANVTLLTALSPNLRFAQPPPDPGGSVGLPVYLCALRI